jgi:acyl carrier protein
MDIGKIEAIVFEAIDELNLALPAEEKVSPSKDTVLFGANGVLDSIGLVNLIVSTEQKLEEEFDVFLTLADEKALAFYTSPFRSIDSFVTYVQFRLEDLRN